MGNAQSSPRAGANALEGLKTVVNILQDISSDLPVPASAVINLVQRITAMLENIRNNRDECELLIFRLLTLLPVVMMTVQRESIMGVDGHVTIPASLKGNVERIQSNLENIVEKVSRIAKVANSKHKLTAAFREKSHAAILQSCRDTLEWAVQLFNVSSHLSDAVRLWETLKKVEQVLSNQNLMSRKTQTIISNSFLESLPRAKYATFDCERPDKPSACFEGTRTAILKLITDWITNPDPTQPHFFWLNGIAGIGKTAVACTIAHLMQDLGLLGAQFCFSRRGEAELRNPALVFPTVAYQLARFDPEFGRRITAALETDPEAVYASFKEQLDRLIIKPLSGLERDPKRVVVLIFDAFDECEARGAKEILQLFFAASASVPLFLKIFITSRPEYDIISVLVPAPNIRIIALHDFDASGEILLLLHHRLRNFGQELGIDLPPDWVTEGEINLIARNAGVLFASAMASLRFLQRGLDPREQLRVLLETITAPASVPSANPFAGMDQVYMQLIRDIIPLENAEEVKVTFRCIMGTIILLRDPLPTASLEYLTGCDNTGILLAHFHSIILIPPPPEDCPRLHDSSFSDFIRDSSRCTDSSFWIDTQDHEKRLARSCLGIMRKTLGKKSLGSLDPFLLNSQMERKDQKIAAAFPPELRYSCRYWASHLSASDGGDGSILHALGAFASSSLLLWLEVMSWIGEVRLAASSLEAAIRWLRKTSSSPVTTSLFHDGYRLLLSHFSTIDTSACHIVQSVFPFAPTSSQIVTTYSTRTTSAIKVIRGADSHWSPCLMTLKGHSAEVKSVAIAPDMSRIATASDDGEIRIWDSLSGNIVATLEGLVDDFQTAAFSPDGSQLVSGSWDGIIRGWDTVTGRPVSETQGHKDVILSVVFSSDGSHVASGSGDCNIRVWDSSSSECRGTLMGHSKSVRAVAFFPDGGRMVSGSDDCTLRMWDLPTGTMTAVLAVHPNLVTSVAVSLDGSHIASGSADAKIRVWDATSSTTAATPYNHYPRMTIQGHGGPVNSVVFNQDQTRIVSASSDRTVRVWDAASGDNLTTLKGHGGPVNSVAISSDGRFIASGGKDTTVKIWDTVAEATNNDEDDPRNAVVSIAFSPDGTKLASLLDNFDVRIWNSSTGHVAALARVRDPPFWAVDKKVNYSLDGTHIVVKFLGHPPQAFDASTGEPVPGAEIHRLVEYHPSLDPFQVVGDRLLLRGPSPPRTVCIFAPEFSVRLLVTTRLDGVGHCVALVNGEGRVVIFHVVL